MRNINIIRLFFGAWITIQAIIIIYLGDIEQMRDAYGYMNNALFCYDNNCLAPSIKECFSVYVQSPGYTNFLVIVYAIFHSFKAVMWLNLIMNSVVVYEIYWLGKHFYTKKVGVIASVLFALMINNLFVPLHILSELPFLFIGLSGFLFVCKGRNCDLVIASILFAIGYTIKPLIYAFFIPAIILLIIRKYNWKSYIAIFFPYIILLQLYGFKVQQETGVKVTSSTTGGFCLCMSAISPWADYTVFQEGGFAYIEETQKLNVLQKDSIRKTKAIEIILNQPSIFIMNCLKKPFLLFKVDSWAFHTSLWNIYKEKLMEPKYNIVSKYFIRGFNHVFDFPYRIVMALFFVSLYFLQRNIFSEKGLLLLIAILGIGATCLFHVEYRYHYPYMFVFCIWAASLFEKTNKTTI